MGRKNNISRHAHANSGKFRSGFYPLSPGSITNHVGRKRYAGDGDEAVEEEVEVSKNVEPVRTAKSIEIVGPHTSKMHLRKIYRLLSFKRPRLRDFPKRPQYPIEPQRSKRAGHQFPHDKPIIVISAESPLQANKLPWMHLHQAFRGIYAPSKLLKCSISTDAARQGLQKIASKTSFRKVLKDAGANLNVKKARNVTELVFGVVHANDGDSFYKELIARIYVQFSRRTQGQISLTEKELYLKSKDGDDDRSLNFKFFDAYVIISGLFLLHCYFTDAWDGYDDRIKETNLLNYLRIHFPDRGVDLESQVSDMKSMEDEGDYDEDEDDGVRIDPDVDPAFKIPEGLPSDGLMDKILNEKGGNMLYYLDRLLFEVILPYLYIHPLKKGEKNWHWFEVRAAMKRRHLFKTTNSQQVRFLPTAVVFADTIFAVICNHPGTIVNDDDSCTVSIDNHSVTIKHKTIQTLAGNNNEPDKDKYSDSYSRVIKIAKFIRMYRLEQDVK